MDVYGLLITKDDHDAVGDWCRDQLPFYKAVVCLDGSESDLTARQLAEFSDRLIYLHERQFEIPSKSDHGLRRVVHNELIRRFGTGIWVMCCHTDEFCYHDPRRIAARAEHEGHDHVSWFSAHFFPHRSELVDLPIRLRLPLQERFRHYHWNHLGSGLPWIEDRLYKAGADVHWDESTHGSVRPHGLSRRAPFHPIYKHFKVCSIDLSMYEKGDQGTLFRHHWQTQTHRTGLSYCVDRIEDLFVTSVKDYDCCTRFDGQFDQPWNIGDEFRPDGFGSEETSIAPRQRVPHGRESGQEWMPTRPLDEESLREAGHLKVPGSQVLNNPRKPYQASTGNRPGARERRPVVQIVGPTDNWILERLARRLASKLPYAVFVPEEPRRDLTAGLAYYVNYALYQGPTSMIDVGFFTHRDDSQLFLKRAQDVDYAICMSKIYADWLQDQGVKAVTHIPMGFDFHRYRPQLVVGVVGKLDHPRKGGELVEKIRLLPFIDLRTTEGRMAEHQLRDFYQSLDYVLIPATLEGGPMCLLEGLCAGKSVIAPESVGMIPEFAQTHLIKRYPTGDAYALINLLTRCYAEKSEGSRHVAERTWDHWAESHHHLFRQLLLSRGIRFPEPARGFRFGMISELEIPASVDTVKLEDSIDEFAAHVYFGRYPEARSILAGVGPDLAFVKRLIETIPSI